MVYISCRCWYDRKAQNLLLRQPILSGHFWARMRYATKFCPHVATSFFSFQLATFRSSHFCCQKYLCMEIFKKYNFHQYLCHILYNECVSHLVPYIVHHYMYPLFVVKIFLSEVFKTWNPFYNCLYMTLWCHHMCHR